MYGFLKKKKILTHLKQMFYLDDINSDIAECFCKNICFLRFFDFYAMKTMNELIQTAIIPFFEELVKTQENAQKPIQTAFELILRTFGSVDKAINKLCQNINSNFSRIHLYALISLFYFFVAVKMTNK